MQTPLCKKPKIAQDVTILFSEALIKKDIKAITALLSEDGEYEIQTPRLNTLEVTKKRFVSWIKKRLKDAPKLTVTFDQCLHCAIGGTVLLINEGTFPRQIKDSSERSKSGLMIKTENGLISQVKFCFVFVKTENKYAFEIEIDRIKELESQGYSRWEAFEMVENEKLL